MTGTYEQAVAIENSDIDFEELLNPQMCEGECGEAVAPEQEGLCDQCIIDAQYGSALLIV